VPGERGRGRPTPVDAVYVHAPFCARRCFYCDFAVTVRSSGGAGEWLEAIAGELRLLEAEGVVTLADSLDSLFVGGGTPSLLGADAMHGLRELIGPRRLDAPSLEWTAEANPESLTADVAARWRDAGVNRLSLGVQTFHDGALRWMGRLHGSQGSVAAVERARAAGFENLSVDLIFGLPAHLGRSWEDDLGRALGLEVPHVSLYGLSVEPGTPLARAVHRGRESVADEDLYRAEYLTAAEVLEGAGFRHYEVSNFAKPGFESRHNGAYWRGAPYLGLGNGAHSYRHPLRRWNLRDWDEYRRAACEARSTVHEEEILDAAATRLERVWLALRTVEGMPEDELGEAALALVSAWAAEGWAVREGGRVRLTASGWLLLDRLSVDMDAALTPRA
jgi:oxygen-independent coproporphyrinogen-3 oxidase